jgi:putative hemolysin
VHDLVDLGVDLPTSDDYSTVAGLVLDRLGHLPSVGESVEANGWRITVLAVEARAITRVRLTAIIGDAEKAPAAPTNHRRLP